MDFRARIFEPSRRRNLRVLAAGIATMTLPAINSAVPHERIFRVIGKSGERLPVIGLGTYDAFDIGDNPSDREPAMEVLKRFVEMGGTLVDSSPMYGRAETVIGNLSAQLNVNEKLWIATKVWTTGRESGISQMNDSLRKLHREKIELMQVHNLQDAKTHLATLSDWKKSGKVKYLGVTHYHAGAYSALEQVIQSREIDFVQLNCSIAEREAEQRILKVAADSGTAVIANRPYANGATFNQVKGKPLPDWARDIDCASWGQFFLKYILGHPAITCVIPATRNPKHLVDNMAAGYGRLPDDAMRRKMATYFDSL
jgi:diketogulonate reductase-like aldo/keto reductase